MTHSRKRSKKPNTITGHTYKTQRKKLAEGCEGHEVKTKMLKVAGCRLNVPECAKGTQPVSPGQSPGFCEPNPHAPHGAIEFSTFSADRAGAPSPRNCRAGFPQGACGKTQPPLRGRSSQPQRTARVGPSPTSQCAPWKVHNVPQVKNAARFGAAFFFFP
jgi:hypothetical protein